MRSRTCEGQPRVRASWRLAGPNLRAASEVPCLAVAAEMDGDGCRRMMAATLAVLRLCGTALVAPGAMIGLAGFALMAADASALAGVTDAACPAGAIAVEAGASIQAAVDRAGIGAQFCLRNGVHRGQTISPKA